MKKILSILGSLLLSTFVLASSETYEATCPKELVDTENQFWALIVNDGTDRITLERVDMKCAVVVPPLLLDDFKKLSMLTEAFRLYPDVLVPWTLYQENGVYIVRGRADSATKKIEFIKVMYLATNGNLSISTTTVSVKVN
jgi:hypothetical protein